MTESLPTSKLIVTAAISMTLVGLLSLGFFVADSRELVMVRQLDCESQSLTDLQVHECQTRLAMKARFDRHRISQLNVR